MSAHGQHLECRITELEEQLAESKKNEEMYKTRINELKQRTLQLENTIDEQSKRSVASSFPHSATSTSATSRTNSTNSTNSSTSSTSSTSNSTRATKQPRHTASRLTLLTILLHQGGGFSYAIVRTINDLLTFEKMASLISINKEVYEAELTLFKAPKEWVDDNQVRMMFGAMISGMSPSRWKLRVDTSLVETLVLGGTTKNGQPAPTNVVNDSWLLFLGDKKFSNLISLDLESCNRISDAGVVELARRCSQIKSLSLKNCPTITKTGMVEVGRRCQHLQSLDISGLPVDDDAITNVAQQLPHLQTLIIAECNNITDEGIKAVARQCLYLQTLNLWACDSITDIGLMEVARHCPHLQTLTIGGEELTDASITAVVQQCLHIQSLEICNSCEITDASMFEVARRCTHLQSLKLAFCDQITDAPIFEVARRCTHLKHLTIRECNLHDEVATLDSLMQTYPNLDVHQYY